MPSPPQWLEELLCNVAVVLATFVLSGRELHRFENHLCAWQLARQRRRWVRRARQHIVAVAPDDPKRQEALLALWRSLHTWHPSR